MTRIAIPQFYSNVYFLADRSEKSAIDILIMSAYERGLFVVRLITQYERMITTSLRGKDDYYETIERMEKVISATK